MARTMRRGAHESEILDRLVAEIERGVGVSEYADDPVRFAEEVLEVDGLTNDQKRILRSIRDNRTTNMKAGHGVGKTFCLAIAVIWWVFAREGRVITTAPTEPLAKILWHEVAELYDRNEKKLGGKRGTMFLVYRGKARADGFVARDYKIGGFAGHHDENLLAIQDEASGISDNIDDGFESCLSYHENRGVRAGNPLADGTPFARACRKTEIRLPVWTHVNVSWAYGEDHELRPEVREAIVDQETGEILPRSKWPDWCQVRDPIPGAVSIEWIEERRAEAHRGPGTAYWISRLDAQFPDDIEDSLVPRSWFDAARARYDADPAGWDERAAAHTWGHGLDVGDGGDPHALCSRRGPVLYAIKEMTTFGDRKDVGRAAGLGRAALEERPGIIRVDTIGVGSGALSSLKEDDELASSAEACNFGAGASDPKKYTNMRAECFYAVRAAFQADDELAIAPLGPYEDALREELAMIRRLPPTSKGLLSIEKKELVKARIGRSPNLADALAMTYTRERRRREAWFPSKGT